VISKATNKNPCDQARAFDQHRTPTRFQALAVTGNFGADLSLMTGTISALGVNPLSRCVMVTNQRRPSLLPP
jgi:hypothetical protein